ncbi:S-layer family protein [Trichormus azollae]|uniref:S-layer family protein n=1 Tax=Trichormus azollae TaxID=1164 RepID=UPI000195742D|nr:S-layer family protein [Trichormus azollae]
MISTAASQSGTAGNLSITAPDRINLQTGSQITSRSTGTGNGGTVEITGRLLVLNQNAQINASTVASNGGNLLLNLSEFLRQSDHSVLNAQAGDTGNGGNISINAPFIIGSRNSDSIANAVRGRGGNINITTNSILGLDFRNQLTPDNDITASSEFGVNGTVQITTPQVNPNFGLVELPVNLVDSYQLIAIGCANTNDSSFVATERGGIPQNPTQDMRRAPLV